VITAIVIKDAAVYGPVPFPEWKVFFLSGDMAGFGSFIFNFFISF
jgi:hypothetical protein